LSKVPVHLSDDVNHFPRSATSHPDPDASSSSGVLLPPSIQSTVSQPDANDLSVLLDALDQNLVEQGVIVEPVGLCAACSKPIIGRVSMEFVAVL